MTRKYSELDVCIGVAAQPVFCDSKDSVPAKLATSLDEVEDWEYQEYYRELVYRQNCENSDYSTFRIHEVRLTLAEQAIQ